MTDEDFAEYIRKMVARMKPVEMVPDLRVYVDCHCGARHPEIGLFRDSKGRRWSRYYCDVVKHDIGSRIIEAEPMADKPARVEKVSVE